jgi:hypothetical protein
MAQPIQPEPASTEFLSRTFLRSSPTLELDVARFDQEVAALQSKLGFDRVIINVSEGQEAVLVRVVPASSRPSRKIS